MEAPLRAKSANYDCLVTFTACAQRRPPAPPTLPPLACRKVVRVLNRQPLIVKTALGPILKFSLFVDTNTLCNLIASSRNYILPVYNRPNAGRKGGVSTDVNYPTLERCSSRPFDGPSPPLPGLSARSIDSQLCCMYARTRWLELIAHYGDCTAPEKHVIEIALCGLPYWYRDFACVRLWPKYSVFDYDSITDPTLV